MRGERHWTNCDPVKTRLKTTSTEVSQTWDVSYVSWSDGINWNESIQKPDPADEKENTLEGRLGGLGASLVNTGLFNNRFTPANTWRPLVTLAKLVPISVNPNSNNPLGTFNTCTSPSGDEGICTPGAVCSLFGGRPGSSCNQGQVCCISKPQKIIQKRILMRYQTNSLNRRG